MADLDFKKLLSLTKYKKTPLSPNKAEDSANSVSNNQNNNFFMMSLQNNAPKTENIDTKDNQDILDAVDTVKHDEEEKLEASKVNETTEEYREDTKEEEEIKSQKQEDALKKLALSAAKIESDIKEGTKLAKDIRAAKTKAEVKDILFDYCDDKETAEIICDYLMKKAKDTLHLDYDATQSENNPFNDRNHEKIMNLLYTNIGDKFVLNQGLLDEFQTEIKTGQYDEDGEEITLPLSGFYANFKGEICSYEYDYVTEEDSEYGDSYTKLTFEENGKKRELKYKVEQTPVTGELIYCISNEPDENIEESKDDFKKRLIVEKNYTTEISDKNLSKEEINKRHELLAQYDMRVRLNLTTLMDEFASEGVVDKARNWISETFSAGISNEDIIKEVSAATSYTEILLLAQSGKLKAAQELCEQEFARRLSYATNAQEMYDSIKSYYGEEIALEIMQSFYSSNETGGNGLLEADDNGKLYISRYEYTGFSNYNRTPSLTKKELKDFSLTINHKLTPEMIKSLNIEGIDQKELSFEDIYSFLTYGGEFNDKNLKSYQQAEEDFTNYNEAISQGGKLQEAKTPEEAFEIITGKPLEKANEADIELFNSYYSKGDEGELKVFFEQQKDELGYPIFDPVAHYYKLDIKAKNDKSGFDIVFQEYWTNGTEFFQIGEPSNELPDYLDKDGNNLFQQLNANKEGLANKWGNTDINENVDKLMRSKFEEFYEQNSPQVDIYIGDFALYAANNSELKRYYAQKLGIKEDEISGGKIALYIKDNKYDESSKYMQYAYTTKKQAFLGESKLDSMTSQYCMEMSTYASNLSHALSIGCMAASVLFPAAAPALMIAARVSGYLDNGAELLDMVSNRQNALDDDYAGWAKSLSFEALTKAGYRYFSGLASDLSQGWMVHIIDEQKALGEWLNNDAMHQVLFRGTTEAFIETGICLPYTMALKTIQGGEYNFVNELTENFIYDFLPYARGWQDILIGGQDPNFKIYGFKDGKGQYYTMKNSNEKVYLDDKGRAVGVVSLIGGEEVVRARYTYTDDLGSYKVVEINNKGVERTKEVKVTADGTTTVTDNGKIVQKTVKTEDGNFTTTYYDKNNKSELVQITDAKGHILSSETSDTKVEYSLSGKPKTVTKTLNGETVTIEYKNKFTGRTATVKAGDEEYSYKVNKDGSITYLSEDGEKITTDESEYIKTILEATKAPVIETSEANDNEEIAALRERVFKKLNEVIPEGYISRDKEYTFAELKVLEKIVSDEKLYGNEEFMSYASSVIETTTSKEHARLKVSLLNLITEDKIAQDNKVLEEFAEKVLFTRYTAGYDYQVDVFEKILSDERLYNNPNIMKRAEWIANSARTEEAASVKIELLDRIINDENLYYNEQFNILYAPFLIADVNTEAQKQIADKILSDEKLYDNQNFMKYISSVLSKVETPYQQEVIEKIISDERLYNNESFMQEALKITDQSYTEKQSKTTIELIDRILNDEKLSNNEDFMKYIGKIVAYGKFQESADNRIDFIDKVVNDEKLYGNEYIRKYLGSLVTNINTPEQAELAFKLMNDERVVNDEEYAELLGCFATFSRCYESAEDTNWIYDVVDFGIKNELSTKGILDIVSGKKLLVCATVDDYEKILSQCEDFSEKLMKNPELYVNGEYESEEEVREVIQDFLNRHATEIFAMFSVFDKETMNNIMRARLDEAADYIKLFSSFDGEDLKLLKGLVSSNNIDDKPIMPTQKVSLMELISAYRHNDMDTSKMLDMVESGKIDIAQLNIDLFNGILKKCGLTEEEISKIPIEKLTAWDTDFAHLLSKEMHLAKDSALSDVIKAASLDDFIRYIQDKSNVYGQTNAKTKALFDENDMDYNAWLRPSDTNNVQFSAKDKNLEQLSQIAAQITEDIEALRRTGAKGFVDKQLAKYIKDGKFVIPTEYTTSKAKLEEFTNNALNQLEKAFKRAERNTDPENEVAQNTLDVREDLNRQLDNIKAVPDSKPTKTLNLTIKMWDRTPQKDIFQGNYSTCCIGMGGANGSAMPHYLLNTTFNMIELVDNTTGKTIGNALCYFVTDSDGKPAFVIDNIEIKTADKPSDDVGAELRNSIVQYAYNVACEVTGSDDTKIYMSARFNDVPTDDLKGDKKQISLLGETDCEKIYMDAYDGWAKREEYTGTVGLLELETPEERTYNLDENLLKGAETLGLVKVNPDGSVDENSIKEFCDTYGKAAQEKIAYIQQNYPDLDKKDFSKLLSVFEDAEDMAKNSDNIRTWLNNKDTYTAWANKLVSSAEGETEKVKETIAKLTGISEIEGAKIKARTKDTESAYDKIAKKVLTNTEVPDYDTAAEKVDDLIGTRIVLDDPSEENMHKLAQNIAQAIAEDKIIVEEINNYSNGSQKYFSQEDIDLIVAAAADKGVEVRILENKQTSKSGYVCTQMKVQTIEDGTLSPKTELQIRSALMDACSELEHITYDIWQGKNITKDNPELEKLFAPVIALVHKLDKNNLSEEYKNYVISCYRYARSFELGEVEGEFKLPEFPESLRGYEVLSWENLEKINEEAHRIKDGNTSEDEEHTSLMKLNLQFFAEAKPEDDNIEDLPADEQELIRTINELESDYTDFHMEKGSDEYNKTLEIIRKYDIPTEEAIDAVRFLKSNDELIETAIDLYKKFSKTSIFDNGSVCMFQVAKLMQTNISVYDVESIIHAAIKSKDTDFLYDVAGTEGASECIASLLKEDFLKDNSLEGIFKIAKKTNFDIAKINELIAYTKEVDNKLFGIEDALNFINKDYSISEIKQAANLLASNSNNLQCNLEYIINTIREDGIQKVQEVIDFAAKNSIRLSYKTISEINDYGYDFMQKAIDFASCNNVPLEEGIKYIERSTIQLETVEPRILNNNELIEKYESDTTWHDKVMDKYAQIRRTKQYTVDYGEENLSGDYGELYNAITKSNTRIYSELKDGWMYHTDIIYRFNDAENRISLNVKGDADLIKRLDKIMMKSRGAFTYKMPKSPSEWGDREDPITLYFSKEPSPELVDKIIEATRPYQRGVIDGASEDTPWLMAEKYITEAQVDELIARAKELNEDLYQYLANSKEGRNKNMSTGLYKAYSQIMDEYETYLKLKQNS